MNADAATRFADIDWRGRAVRLEYRWTGDGAAPSGDGAAPVVVFLHEGLGSVAMWKDFPERFCARTGLRGLVFSRPGYGRSTPRAADEHWAPDFMHRQANEVLPALFDALGIDRPWLFGHSDGGSIALLHAAQRPVAGVIVVAPHLFVEPVSVASIEKARDAYAEAGESGLRERLVRYHDDVDSAFFGWNDVWLSPAFRAWNIEAELAGIACPLLAVQGADDEYGTLAQIERIRDRLPATELVVLPHCGHSPHRDRPDALIDVAARFAQVHSRERPGDPSR